MSNQFDFNKYIRSSDAIFHYTSASIALEEILLKGKFRLSLLKDTNDPSEYKVKLLDMMGTPEEHAQDLHVEASLVIDRVLRNESRVMSFCSNESPTIMLDSGKTMEDTTVNNNGWSKSRMWSQYGEDHKGLCLVFSREALEAEFVNIGEHLIAKNIKYNALTDQFPFGAAHMLDGNQISKDGVEKYSIAHIRRYADTLLFTKNIDYRDEGEYRVVIFDADNKYEYINIERSIRGIISGDRTSEVYLSLIRDLANQYEVDCRSLFWERGTPFLGDL